MNLGTRGEEQAQHFFLEHGYEILAQNYRSGPWEIDLIIQVPGEMIAFVEVKSRKAPSLVPGKSAVNLRKQRKIARGALGYLEEKSWEGNYRFDVVEVNFFAGGRVEIEHIEDAFSIRDVLDDMV